MKKWREKNKDKVKEYRHNYYVESLSNGKYVPPSNEASREYLKKWREKNRDKYREYQRNYQAGKRMQIAIDKCPKV
jgi:hypothetical protein